MIASRLCTLKRPACVRSLSALPGIDPTNIRVTKTTTPREKVAKEKLVFGQTFTDHMLTVDWHQDRGWARPEITPYGPMSIDPAASVFHYALECFEGMKAYKDADGEIRLFRPDLNMERMNNSMERLSLPTFDGDAMTECLKELIRIDADWIPQGEGYSLYIRPTGISTHPNIGVSTPSSARVFIILCPVGPYYPEGFNPISLYADTENIRAWPGGMGNKKVGGNYAPTIMPAFEAANKGYSQVLWLYGEDHQVTEVGTMNLFFFWKNENGETELVTAPLSRGDILPGVTRRSVLELARSWGEFKVTERNITMAEVTTAIKEGRMIEAFGSGTAAVLSPIKLIAYKGVDYSIPLASGNSGELCNRLWQTITSIQDGRLEHEWSVVV